MSSASTPEQATLLHREAPCGCIIQVGSGEETTTGGGGGGCPCQACGADCRCIADKGHCSCSKAAVVAPRGCVVDTASEELCPTCGVKGCRCIADHGRCLCAKGK